MPDYFAYSGSPEEKNILSVLHARDVESANLFKILDASGIKGIRASSSEELARRAMAAAKMGAGRVGIKSPLEFTLRDNSVLDIVFKKGGVIQNIPIPLPSGFTTKYLGREIESRMGVTFTQPGYVVPGAILLDRPVGQRKLALGEMVAEQFEHSMRNLQWGEERQGLKRAKQSVFSIFKNAVWTASDSTGGKYYPPANLDTPAAILHATKYQVMLSGGKEPADWTTVISGEGGRPFKDRGEIDWSEALKDVVETRQRYAKDNVFDRFTDLALKAESGLKGYVTSLTMGQITPFGEYADPVRQAYQTWAVRPLVGRGAGYTRLVSTEAFEGATKAINMTSRSVGEDSFYAAGRFLLTTDLEKGAQLSAGGSVFTRKFLERLKYRSPAGEIRTPTVGTALQIGRHKVTVGAVVEEISGGIEGVLSLYPMAKHGDEVRTQLISTVLSDLSRAKTDPHVGRKIDFLGEIAKIVGATPLVTPQGEYTLQLKGDAKLDRSELTKIRQKIKEYNAKSGNSQISSDLQFTSAQIQAKDSIQVSGMIASMGAGVRDKSEISGIDAVVGVSKSFGKRGRLRVNSDRGHRINIETSKRGMKISMREVMNLKIYGNPESDALASVMLQAMAGYRAADKKEIWKALIPLQGTHRVAGGMKISELPAFRPIDLSKPYFTAEELAGTFYDPFGKFASTGIPVNLSKPVAVAGQQGEVGLMQVFFPAPQTIGMGRTTITEGGKSSVVYRISSLGRTEVRALEAISRGDPGVAVREWFDKLGAAVTGKTGRMAKYTQPRILGGTLRAIPGGIGPEAEALGTALREVTLPSGEIIPASQVVGLNPQDIQALGTRGARTFGLAKDPSGAMRKTPIGTAWIGVMRHPNQEAAHYAGMLGVADPSVPRGAIRVGAAIGLAQRGDQDKDQYAFMLITGRAGQRMIKQHALKNTQPRLAAAAAFLETQMSEQAKMLKAGGNLVAADAYQDFVKLAQDSLTFDKNSASLSQQQLAELFYGTKKLTGLVDYKMQAMREMLAVGKISKGREVAGAIYSEVQQQAAIAKSKGNVLLDAARSLFAFSTTSERLTNAANNKADVDLVSQLVTNMWNELKKIKPTKAVGIQGSLPGLLGNKSAAEVANLIQQGSVAFVEGAALYNTTQQDMVRGVGSGLVEAFKGEKTGLQGIGDAVAAFRLALRSGSTAVLDEHTRMWAQATNFEAALSEMVPGSALGQLPVTQAMDNALRQKAGAEGQGLPAPILDSMINWFKNPKTPALHKAGVITGSILLGGAIVKNMFFPGYHPADESVPTHVAVPIPLRMPAYEMPTESIFDDVPMTRTPTDSQFSMPLQYGNMGFRARPPAVQMGAGTMEPGIMPFLTGSPNKGPVPAPMVLNHASYENEATNPIPQTVRVAAPKESLASSYLPTKGYAEVSSGLDMRQLTRQLSSGSIRFEGYNDRSDREMLSMLEEQEGSNFT